jgi:glucosylceramidase
VIHVDNSDKDLMVTAAKNPGSTVACGFNEGDNKDYTIRFRESEITINLTAQTLQTVIIPTLN